MVLCHELLSIYGITSCLELYDPEVFKLNWKTIIEYYERNNMRGIMRGTYAAFFGWRLVIPLVLF